MVVPNLKIHVNRDPIFFAVVLGGSPTSPVWLFMQALLGCFTQRVKTQRGVRMLYRQLRDGVWTKQKKFRSLPILIRSRVPYLAWTLNPKCRLFLKLTSKGIGGRCLSV
jgi:hypothetical protein